jgi:hypothetical protein
MEWMDAQTPKESSQLALDAITRGSKMTKQELQDIPEYRCILAIVEQID